MWKVVGHISQEEALLSVEPAGPEALGPSPRSHSPAFVNGRHKRSPAEVGGRVDPLKLCDAAGVAEDTAQSEGGFFTRLHLHHNWEQDRASIRTRDLHFV